ncbi:UPF0389 protein GA21628 [Leptopilina boulardi]|uniref:UPF0389 protein GA21628 n=1 Tax=Leptopilina boulardi TaxID=63433 RepID=UPI0021F5E961|nr:UPF0389 protein GA21628 [Leptopilina boulardi]XP_051173349.1 UPF0389 protein GA21628 [Leptopilina boulardi]
MFGSEMQRNFILNSIRNIHQSAKIHKNKEINETLSTDEAKNVERQQKPLNKSELSRHHVNVRLIDKYLLVWFKKYKSINDVPSRIPEGILDHIHSKSRIRIANIIMVCGLILCGWATWSGKKSMEEGDSFTKQIEDRHKRVREEYLQSQAKQSKDS